MSLQEAQLSAFSAKFQGIWQRDRQNFVFAQQETCHSLSFQEAESIYKFGKQFQKKVGNFSRNVSILNIALFKIAFFTLKQTF